MRAGSTFLTVTLNVCFFLSTFGFFSSHTFRSHFLHELHRVQCDLLLGVRAALQLWRWQLPPPSADNRRHPEIWQQPQGSGERRRGGESEVAWSVGEEHSDKGGVSPPDCPFHSPSQLYNIFPQLMEWLPGPQHKTFARIEELREFIMKKIREHQDTLDPSSPRDYIDCFLTRLTQVWQYSVH